MAGDRIAFRRVRGRIIPIKIKSKSDKAIVSAVGFSLASLAVGGGAAELAFRVNRKSAELRQKARFKFGVAGTFKNLIKRSSDESLRQLGKTKAQFRAINRKQILKAINLRGKSTLLRRLRNPILGAGAITAGALLSTGLGKIFEVTGNKKRDASEEFLGNVAAGVAALGVSAFYYTRLSKASGVFKGFRNLAAQVVSRVRKTPRPSNIPIPTKFGTLRF